MSPALESPRHLAPFVELLESTLTTPRRVVVSTPPQHGKTLTTSHGLVWLLQRRPALRNAYVTYEAHRAEDVSLQAMQVAAEAGLAIEGARRVWRTKAGGGLLATGIGGPLTGYPVDGLAIVDDPLKNRAEAESAVFRDRTLQWFRDVLLTRAHPGASVIVIQTRWHPDDLAGQLIREGWEAVNLPAIDDQGNALWPEKRPREYLDQVRAEVGEYTWAALYQGTPRPRGGSLFGDVALVDELPTGSAQYSIGLDLAYSKRSHADYSVAVVMAQVDGIRYVADVLRTQDSAPEFSAKLRRLVSRYPGVRPRWYCAGTELGVADFVSQELGARIDACVMHTDKFSRAQPYAASWNAGKVVLPRFAPWASVFIDEHRDFTGVADDHDDQVDAAAAAHDALAVAANSGSYDSLTGNSRWH